jgi:hypothetical protein
MSKDKVEFRTRSDGVVYPVTQGGKTRRVEYSEAKTFPTKCPGCGRAVYYFQDENGGKVYFSSMGPPWPKHDCRLANHNANLGIKPKGKRCKRKSKNRKVVAPNTKTEIKPVNKPSDVEKPIDIQSNRSKIYPRFNSGNLKKVLFRLDPKKVRTAFVYFTDEIYVDAFRIKEMVMIPGMMVFIPDSAVQAMRCEYMESPVYLVSQNDKKYTLATHVLKDGVVLPFRFDVTKVEGVKRCLDDVL